MEFVYAWQSTAWQIEIEIKNLTEKKNSNEI